MAGCSYNHKDYNSDYKIAGDDSYSCQNRSINLSDDKKSVFCKINHIDGFFEIANADLLDNCNVKINFEGSIKSGKAKLVLVKPDGSIQILKEITSTENENYSEDILLNCSRGVNKIKFVGENCKIEFKISQFDNEVFNYNF